MTDGVSRQEPIAYARARFTRAILELEDAGEAVQWLRQGLLRWRAGDEDLETCLGLAGSRQAVRNGARDDCLANALSCIEGPSFNARVEKLASAVERFERRLWSKYSDYERPPTGLSSRDRAIFHARKAAGRQLPGLRQLHRILQSMT